MLYHNNSSTTRYFFGWETNAFQTNEHIIICENLFFFLSLLMFILYIQLYSKIHQKTFWFPDSIITLFLSTIVGIILRFTFFSTLSSLSSSFLVFNPHLFYFFFLPIIIFTSGFHINRYYLHQYFFPISLLALLGTLLTTILTCISMKLILYYFHLYHISFPQLTWFECLGFASLLSSTDPVSTLAIYQQLQINSQLFYLVFGESILNDAIAITLYKTSMQLIDSLTIRVNITILFTIFINFWIIFLVSMLIGYIMGIFFAYICKFLHLTSKASIVMPSSPSINSINPSFTSINSPINSINSTNTSKLIYQDHIQSLLLLFFLLSCIFISFLLVEIIQLSGIVTNFFFGISIRRYMMKNIKQSTKHLFSFLLELLSFLSETICFIIMGLTIGLYSFIDCKHWFDYGLWILLLLIICMFTRFITVFCLLIPVRKLSLIQM